MSINQVLDIGFDWQNLATCTCEDIVFYFSASSPLAGDRVNSIVLDSTETQSSPITDQVGASSINHSISMISIFSMMVT